MSNDPNIYSDFDTFGVRANRCCQNTTSQVSILPVNTNIQNSCCCKNALRHSVDLLLNPCIRKLIDLTSFTLIGQNFTTSPSATTIKSIANCGESLITFSDTSCTLTTTTFCDLIAIRFNLIAPNLTTEADTEEEIAAIFSLLVQRLLPKINPNQFCCKPESRCCCNRSKASFLANSIGPVNVQLNTSALNPNPLTNQTVITVTEHIAWFIDSTNTISICCLDGICAIG